MFIILTITYAIHIIVYEEKSDMSSRKSNMMGFDAFTSILYMCSMHYHLLTAY